MGIIKRLISIFAQNSQEMFAENKLLIAGLGNPGPKYEFTRHNAGYVAANKLIEKHSVVFADARLAFRAQFRLRNKTIVVIKPTTFMNLSGKAIAYYLEKEKIPVSSMIVISDDIALPFGQIRIRKKGGAGGHNGLQNIIDVLGTSDFARIRVGIGGDFVRGFQSEYVLDEWDETEKNHLSGIFTTVISACETFALSGIDNAMNQCNSRESEL
jgi:peptidyl-tRNA hydrolase, PTH1 family